MFHDIKILIFHVKIVNFIRIFSNGVFFLFGKLSYATSYSNSGILASG